MKLKEQLKWKSKIIGIAQELGFSAVGFTSSDPIVGLALFLEKRREFGYHTSFEEKELARRVDVKKVWPECKTVVVLAYPLPFTTGPGDTEGVLSRSAVGVDYHMVVGEKLDDLIIGMVEAGWEYVKPKTQVDTGPLNERAFAVRAGLGWIGRNQQLIIPKVGSFAALALMFLDQELPSDSPIENLCGNCQKCIEACPSHILGDENFKANQCLSYITQSKEKLTSIEVERLGQRIFGCDTCQETCPHNQKWLQIEAEALEKLPCGVDPWQVLNLTKGQFHQIFKNTAAGWRGKGILQRNAYFALKKLGDPRLVTWEEERKKEGSWPPILAPYLGE